ncbi:MAG: polyprenyl synthetase family protein [Succinivibrio sp.]
MTSVELQANQDLEKVEDILNTLISDSSTEANVNAMCQHVVKAGGKRIRPRLSILTYHALQGGSDNYSKMLHFAAASELLHTATLVHDDVIDKATTRRGAKTLNDTSGNHAAVLAGDYLFTRCFVCLHNINCNELYNLVNSTLAALVRGELNQLENKGKVNLSIDDYLKTIYCKTGALFEMATSGVAILNGENEDVIKALALYGKQLGIAFQVADDLLDYTSDPKVLGKDTGEDLSDGRITLPVILALRDCNDEERSGLAKAVENNSFETVKDFIEKKDSIRKSLEFALDAVKNAQNALSCLEDNEFKKALTDLALKAAKRYS